MPSYWRNGSYRHGKSVTPEWQLPAVLLKLLGFFKDSVLEDIFFPLDKPTLICIGSIYQMVCVPWRGRRLLLGRSYGDSACLHGHMGRGHLTPAGSPPGTGPAGHRWQLRRPRYKKGPLKVPQEAVNLNISAGAFRIIRSTRRTPVGSPGV